MRWNNWNSQQDYGPWNAAADIASAIMQRNQQRAQDKKDLQSTQSLFGLLQPSDVDTGTGMRSQVNLDPSLQKVNTQQPQRKPFDFSGIGQTPPIYNGPQEQQPIGLMQPQQVTGQNALTMPQQPAPQIQAPTVTQKERTIKDVENDIRKSYAARMQAAVKSGVTPAMLKQYMPQILQQRDVEIEQARGDYTKQQEQTAWANFEKAPDYKSKMMTGIKAGLNPQLLKLALDSGMEVKTIDLGDRTLPLGIGKDGSIVNLITGKPPTQEELTKGVSADAKYSVDNRPAPVYREPSSGSNRSDIDIYKWASSFTLQPTGAVDSSGKPLMTRVQNNPTLARQLGIKLGFEQGDNNTQGEDPRIAEARALGYSDAEIQAFLNGSPQPTVKSTTQRNNISVADLYNEGGYYYGD